MVSNLSTIGFDYDDEAKLSSTLAKVAASSAPASSGSPYAVWRSPTGAALWFHINESGTEIVGLTPFFEGRSAVPLKITSTIVRPGDTSHEGGLMAWVAPDDEQDGVYPIVFDALEFAALADARLPLLATTRIVGFAHQLRAFPSAEAYEASQTAEPKFAAQSFVPIGMFAASADDDAGTTPPSSSALLTGRIAHLAQLTNDATQQPFYALYVESLEAGFDIVAHPDVIEGILVPGGTIEVSCGLFGRLLDPQ